MGLTQFSGCSRGSAYLLPALWPLAPWLRSRETVRRVTRMYLVPCGSGMASPRHANIAAKAVSVFLSVRPSNAKQTRSTSPFS